MSGYLSQLARVLTDLEEAFHGLQTADGTKVNAILERAHRYKGACENAFPVLKQAVRCWGHLEVICDESPDGGQDARWKDSRASSRLMKKSRIAELLEKPLERRDSMK